MTVCCGYARITVRRPAGGAVVPGATVTSPILGLTATADGSGVALLGPFGATQMRALPPSGGDCSTRLLSVEASAEGYLSACDLVEVSCGSTGESPAESTVELLPLDTDGDGTPDFVRDTDWCEDRGCLEPSYANRGLLANLRVLVAQMEIWGTDSAWHDVLGGTGNVAINSILYDNLRTGSSGFPESPWEDTPYSAPVPDIEYRATGSHAGTVPAVVRNIGGSCSGIWGAAKFFLRKGQGLLIRVAGPDDTAGSSQTVPGGQMPCPEDVSYVDFLLEFDWNPCLTAWPMAQDTGWITVSDGAGPGRHVRYRVQITT